MDVPLWSFHVPVTLHTVDAPASEKAAKLAGNHAKDVATTIAACIVVCCGVHGDAAASLPLMSCMEWHLHHSPASD